MGTTPYAIASSPLAGTSLRGRVALVSGASSGLGAHFAALLARHGARVAACARRVSPIACSSAADVAGDGTAAGAAPAGRVTDPEAGAPHVPAPDASASDADAPGEIVSFPLDVTEAAAVAACVADVRARFGRIDILVNNAGITRTGKALDVSQEDFDAVLGTNLGGAWRLARAVAPHLRDAGGGSIVNIASILGLRVAGGVAPYAISKAALLQMTRVLALEWARHGIRVNALAPGYIETDINREFFATDAGRALVARIPQRRLGQMHELDGPLLLLASDAGAYMTGCTLACDGGHLISSL